MNLRVLTFLLFASITPAQVTVTGLITDAGGNPATSGYVQFDIIPRASSVQYFVAGTSTIAPQSTQCGINVSGQVLNFALSGPCKVYGNDVITPGNTTYKVTFAPGSNISNVINNELITGTNYSLNNPVFAQPVQTSPQQGVIFANPFQTNILPIATNTYNIGSPLMQYATIYANQIFQNGILVPTLAGNNTWTGTNIFNLATTLNGGTLNGLFLGSPVFKYLNNSRKADGFPGIDASVKMNACIADVIAVGGGTCDATGLIGNQTISQEVDIGNRAQVPVLLLIPQQFTWNVTINDCVSSGFKIFSGSTFFGPAQQPVGVNTATIQAAPTACVVSLFTTEPNPLGAGQYVRVEGFTLYNPSGATISDAALVARNLYDNSAFRNITVASFNGTNLHVSGACCQVIFDRITLNGGSLAGAVPLKVDLAYGTNAGISFTNMSIDHPGDTLNNIVITGGTTPLTASQVNFFGLYMEGTTQTAHLTTPLVSITGGGRYKFDGVTVSRLAIGSTAYVFDITNASFPTLFQLNGFGFYSDLGANTYTTGGEAVNDHIKPIQVKADVNGLLASYSSGGVVLTTSGNLGVGVANPSFSLDTVGSVRVTNQFISTQVTGIAPLVVASTTPVPNLTVQNCSSCVIGGGSVINTMYRASGVSLNSAFTAITAPACQEQTLTVTGAATTGTASVSPTATIGANFSWSSWVSSSNTVSVRVCAFVTGTPTSVTWNATVVQ